MKILFVPLLLALTLVRAQKPATAPSSAHLPFSISLYDRTRVDASQWFAAPPQAETYGYGESLVRIGLAQRIRHFDWQLELAQPSILDAPSTSVSPITAQGQLGLGATYYVANANNSYPAAASLKQAFVRYHFGERTNSLRAGRFEFTEGVETQPKDASLAWLQTNRIAQRLIGNFGFSTAQRSYDGLDALLTGKHLDLTAMAARADQGVFNMNANPELNVDLQYLALSGGQFKQHLIWRAFGLGYHDGRTGLTKTDNRPLAVRAADHHNIRLGTYGGDVLTTVPLKSAQVDALAWGAYQNGSWGMLDDSAGAVAVEGGIKLTKLASTPWLRGGFFYSTGDGNATDNVHNTFFQVLPTPRVYARFPFYNLMNSKDQFAQVIDRPTKRLELRSDLHWLQLSSPNDLWYQGGGAYDNKVFGYTGRPANGHASFASLADASADWQATPSIAINLYYAHVWGKSVVGTIYPANRTAQYGYLELVYRFGIAQRAAVK